MAAYLNKYPDAIALFYDNEFGATIAYLEAQGIDPSRVIHIPITNIEELKFDLIAKLKEIKRGDKVFILVDSLGNAASIKELEDAEKGNTNVDMTRAKAMKSLFRMITPQIKMKNIMFVGINHTYQTLEMFSKTVVGGGTGGIYSADTIFIITKAQEKDAAGDLIGFNFTINIEKSRFIQEKSKLPFFVSWEEGIDKWSGLFELALDAGFIHKPKKGVYQLIDFETGEFLEKEYKESKIPDEFYEKIVINEEFKRFVEARFKL
jgi:hypothetical protein